MTSRPSWVGVQDGRFFEQRADVSFVVIVLHGIRAGEERLPVAQREKEFLIVLAGIVAAIDVDEAELAGIGALVQVVHGHGVRVVPAGSGRAGSELDSGAVRGAAPSGEPSSSMPSTSAGIKHAVPMHQLRCVRIVDYYRRLPVCLRCMRSTGPGAVPL